MKPGSLVLSLLCLQLTAIAVVVSHNPSIDRLVHHNVQRDLRTQPVSQNAMRRIVESYGKIPLGFEENRGQTDAQVKFLTRGTGYTLFLTGTEAVLSLAKPEGRHNPQIAPISQKTDRSVKSVGGKSEVGAVLRMKLVAANPAPEVIGLEELPGRTNYLIGNNPEHWRTGVPAYSKIKYRDVYPGVDLIYYGNSGAEGQLEYDVVVAPGADPGSIRMEIEGADRFEIDSRGDLALSAGGEDVRLRKPVIYQEEHGIRRGISGGYVIRGRHQVGFQLAAYDVTKPLVIDPSLVYSTYLGGSNSDFAGGIAVDSAGNAYVTGFTGSTDFPTATPFQPTNKSSANNVFVAKLNPIGSALLYSTYLGGRGDDRGSAIAVDAFGSAYITGSTTSTDFPTANPIQATNGGGDADLFVARLNANGSALVYSTYLGGRGDDEAQAIAIDSSGNTYVTGFTSSINFPTRNPFQPANGGGDFDVFVTKLNPTGSTLVYSTYLGGSDDDEASGIAADSSGNAYVTGYTVSANFPTVNPLQSAAAGGTCGTPLSRFACADVFVTKLNPAGSALVYSTYLGGNGDEGGNGVAVDAGGNAYVTGFTGSANFPTVNPVQRSFSGGACPIAINGPCHDAFVAKLNPSGAALVYSTYLGGSDEDSGRAIAVDASGNAYVAGATYSSNFPTAIAIKNFLGPGTCGREPNTVPCPDAFVAKFNAAGSALVYSTYLGGGDDDQDFGIALDASGNVYVAGSTASNNFPASPGAFQAAIRSQSISDAFIVKISDQAGRPSVNPGGTINGASFAARAAVAPGSIVSTFGTNLSSSSGGATVQLNGIAAFLFGVSGSQINFQVPWELAGQTQATLTVNTGAASNAVSTVALTQFAPGIFTANSSGSGQGAITISATGEIAAPLGSFPGFAARPVNRGEFISIFCTGLGPVTNQPASGAPASGTSISVTTTTPTVTIGGVPVSTTGDFFSGLAPGFVGLYQVNAQVPASVTPGSAVSLVLSIGGAVSNTVTIAVQ